MLVPVVLQPYRAQLFLALLLHPGLSHCGGPLRVGFACPLQSGSGSCFSELLIPWGVAFSVMYAPVAEVTDNADEGEFCIAVQYLHPQGGHLPAVLQHAEAYVDRYGTFLEAVTRLEHTGCASGQLRAILAVVQQGPPSMAWTPRPPQLGPPDELDPDGYPRRLGGHHSTGASSAALAFPPTASASTHAVGVSSALASSENAAAGSGSLGAQAPAALTSAEAVALVDRIFARRPGDSTGDAPSPTSPCLSEITERSGASDRLPVPAPVHLTSDEREALRSLAIGIHHRIRESRGGPGDQLYELANWYTSLRYLSTEIPEIVPPDELLHLQHQSSVVEDAPDDIEIIPGGVVDIWATSPLGGLVT